jgi:hypothetical protein
MAINRQLQNEGARGPSAAQQRAPPPGTWPFSAADDMKVGLETRGLKRDLENKQKALALLVKLKQRIAKAEKELAKQNERRRDKQKLSNVATTPVPV